MKQLDAALVGYLGLGAAAREIQGTLQRAGLDPPPNTGTEAVARMLGLRLNHPAAQDDLELLPNQPATRAEAAYSFAQLLQLGASAPRGVQQAADAFTLPTFTPWQQTHPHDCGALRRLPVRLGRDEPDAPRRCSASIPPAASTAPASSGASTS